MEAEIRTASILICVTTILLTTMSRVQPVEVCNFTRPVRLIDTSEGLPAPIRDAVVRDGVVSPLPLPGQSPWVDSSNPHVIGAGRQDDFYFVWGEYGDLAQAYNINLYRLRAGESIPERVKHFTSLAIGTKLCPLTENLLQTSN